MAIMYYSRTSVLSVIKPAANQMYSTVIESILPGAYPIVGSDEHGSDMNLSDVSNQSHTSTADVHMLDKNQEHTFQHQPLSPSHLDTTHGTIYKASVAVGLGITTRKMSNIDGDNIVRLPFFRSLLKSFCETASNSYDYHFFLAYDYNDKYLSQHDFLENLANTFTKFTNSKCPKKSAYSLHFVMCSHTKKPAWAQNDAMIEAYLSGMEYFYRINDDTVMKTKNWTERFIDTLDKFIPCRIGVVGPKHRGGNTAILTYDFTHRTHLEVHGFYYPREFPDWYGDRWVTEVYKPGRSIKLPDVLLVHTMETGQRYRNTRISGTVVNGVVQRDRATVIRYLFTTLSTDKQYVSCNQQYN